MEFFVFVVAAAMILAGAVGVVVRSHPVHAALSLILTLFGVAVMFVSLRAEFLGAVQVIVYAGAIVVLFLFVIMLLGVDRSEDLKIEPFGVQTWVAAVVGVGVAGLVIVAAVLSREVAAPLVTPSAGVQEVIPAEHDSNIRSLARDLFSDHVLAFELTSVLLVIAVVGTVLLARKPKRGEVSS